MTFRVSVLRAVIRVEGFRHLHRSYDINRHYDILSDILRHYDIKSDKLRHYDIMSDSLRLPLRHSRLRLFANFICTLTV